MYLQRNFLVYIDYENVVEVACYSTALVFVIDFTDCSAKTGVREVRWPQSHIGRMSSL